jgi:predicted nucleotidyltransferase
LTRRLREKHRRLEKKECDNVFDIVLFGSAVKGKLGAEDVDVCIVFKRGTGIEKTLKKIRTDGVHLTHLSLDALFSEPLWLTLILEGESVLKEKRIAAMLGLSSAMIFTYDLRALEPAKKTAFYNAVLGRGNLLKGMGAEPLGRGCVLVPMRKSEEFRAVLDRWGVAYSAKQGLFV